VKDNIQIEVAPLKKVSFNQFKEFLDSLDEEKKTWSLDMQFCKTELEFYQAHADTYNTGVICIDVARNKVVGLLSFYNDSLETSSGSNIKKYGAISINPKK